MSVIQYAICECSLGFLLVAMSEQGVCAIIPGDSSAELVSELRHRFPRAKISETQLLEDVLAAIVMHLDDPAQILDFPLDIQGTDFQQHVWQALQKIPVGVTVSYSDIANTINAPKSVRAVANACAANALAIVIPCHRVVKNDGSLSGYRWGVQRKRALLDKEAGLMS